MKQFIRAACVAGLALGTIIIGCGSFSPASAESYYRHQKHHHYRERYNRTYRHCARHYRIGGYRFERCMHYQLEKYRDW